ncbi:MMPL family transporter [bacterium]|nr:MMPL family transporter [bacterium]
MSRHPWMTLGVVVALTVVLGRGMLVAEDAPASSSVDAFLPDDSPLALAQVRLAADFPEQAGLSSTQIVLRGNILSSEGLEESYRLVEQAAADPRVAPLLASSQPVLSPAHLIRLITQGEDPSVMSSTEIAGRLALASTIPEAAPVVDAVQSLVATDADGLVTGGVGVITLFDPGDLALLEEAQWAIDEIARGFQMEALTASTVSGAVVRAESQDTISSSTPILMGLALAVIVAILVVFYRAASDVMLAVAGLGLTIVWTTGFQGWLGPGGMDLIGSLDTLEMMVPVALIGLSVDFALQISGRYRDAIGVGMGVTEGVATAASASAPALLLAAGTTALAFGTNVVNTIPPIRYFGIVAAAGVLFGLVVMGLLVPAARLLVDKRRVAAGQEVHHESLDDALPRIGRMVGRLSGVVVGAPLVVLAVVAVITFYAASRLGDLESTFDQTDLLPAGEVLDDIEFMQGDLGGRSEIVTILVEADLSSDRTLRDLVDLELGMIDGNRKPEAVSGPVTLSLVSLVRDWADDSGLPGDRFDPAFADFLASLETGLVVEAVVIESIYDELRAIDPDGLAAVAAFHAGGLDATIVQFPARTGDQDASRRLVEQVERLWFGEDDAIVTLGGEIVTVSITDELTASQTTGVGVTIAATLLVLLIYFGLAHFRPVLGLFAVIPVVVVLVWVLGSMVVLGISYNAVTALITALTIGVGVDYTIHLTHRFLEERHSTHSISMAMRETMHTTGGALIGSALTTALGFAVLLFAPLAPMRHFGILTALTILYSLIAAFVILPPTLTLWAIYHRWREQAFAGDPDRAAHGDVYVGSHLSDSAPPPPPPGDEAPPPPPPPPPPG